MADVSFIEQGHAILDIFNNRGFTEPHDFIAKVARTCYRSKGKTAAADEQLVRSLIKNGHHAMLEHSFMSVRFVTNRAIANEIVRHRHFSFAQESTRFCNYSNKGFEFILPDVIDESVRVGMEKQCYDAANYYEALVRYGIKPEIARSILPLCTATRIVVSGNFREWRHMLSLRTAPDAHPQMRALMLPLLDELRGRVPVIFDDLGDA